MSALPLEILEHICECAAQLVAAPGYGEQVCSAGELGPRDTHYSALIGFSSASQRFREISAPYLFRRLKVRTVEQAALIVASPLLGYARHIHLPAVDALTCRRPVAASVRRLVSRVPSLRISAADSSFFFNARAPLSGLLRSTSALQTLEVYCGPILEGFDTLNLIADLIPACPGSLKALHFAMPGGKPDYSGVETLLDAIGSTLPPGTDGRLSGLETISISVHLIPYFASRPERLALALARRLPALRTVTFVAPGRNTRKEISVLDLIGSSTEREAGSRHSIWTWQVQRDLDMICAGAKYELGGNVSLEGVSGLELDILV